MSRRGHGSCAGVAGAASTSVSTISLAGFACAWTTVRGTCIGQIAARILIEEQALLGHLQTVTHDLDRRIRSREAKYQW